jgi:hypothetical protein
VVGEKKKKKKKNWWWISREGVGPIPAPGYMLPFFAFTITLF